MSSNLRAVELANVVSGTVFDEIPACTMRRNHDSEKIKLNRSRLDRIRCGKIPRAWGNSRGKMGCVVPLEKAIGG